MSENRKEYLLVETSNLEEVLIPINAIESGEVKTYKCYFGKGKDRKCIYYLTSFELNGRKISLKKPYAVNQNEQKNLESVFYKDRIKDTKKRLEHLNADKGRFSAVDRNEAWKIPKKNGLYLFKITEKDIEKLRSGKILYCTGMYTFGIGMDDEEILEI